MTKNIFVRKKQNARAAGQSSAASFFLATVASASDGVTIVPDGQTEAIPKKFKIMLSGQAAPAVGDRVVVMKHSGTCIILGALGAPSDIDDKVSKSGDTMTGALTTRDAPINVDDPDFTVGTRPSANQWTMPLRFRDSAGKAIARVLGFYGSDGRCGIQIYGDQVVNGEGKYNYLSLSIDENGLGYVNMNYPAAWRSALGLGTNGVLPLTVAQGGSGQTGVITETTVSEIATPATGWTITSATFARWGKLAAIELNIKTTEQVTVTYTDPVATLVQGKRPAVDAPARCWLSTSRVAAIRPSGQILMTEGTINADVGYTIISQYLLP